jgi:hypothetical protein
MSGQLEIERHGEEFPVVAYPVKDGGWWLLLDEDVERLKVEFPGVDVEYHCGKAFDWAFTRKSRHKTARGMPQFLRTWLSKQRKEIQ